MWIVINALWIFNMTVETELALDDWQRDASWAISTA
jgi:hypothetical protein